MNEREGENHYTLIEENNVDQIITLFGKVEFKGDVKNSKITVNEIPNVIEIRVTYLGRSKSVQCPTGSKIEAESNGFSKATINIVEPDGNHRNYQFTEDDFEEGFEGIENAVNQAALSGGSLEFMAVTQNTVIEPVPAELIIHGSIGGSIINCAGSVTLNNVEDSIIKCTGDVTVEQIGKDTIIKAKGDVRYRFKDPSAQVRSKHGEVINLNQRPQVAVDEEKDPDLQKALEASVKEQTHPKADENDPDLQRALRESLLEQERKNEAQAAPEVIEQAHQEKPKQYKVYVDKIFGGRKVRVIDQPLSDGDVDLDTGMGTISVTFKDGETSIGSSLGGVDFRKPNVEKQMEDRGRYMDAMRKGGVGFFTKVVEVSEDGEKTLFEQNAGLSFS